MSCLARANESRPAKDTSGATRVGTKHTERVLFQNSSLRRHLWWSSPVLAGCWHFIVAESCILSSARYSGFDPKTATENRKKPLGLLRGELDVAVLHFEIPYAFSLPPVPCVPCRVRRNFVAWRGNMPRSCCLSWITWPCSRGAVLRALRSGRISCSKYHSALPCEYVPFVIFVASYILLAELVGA